LCRPTATVVHTDAVQVVGKLPVHFGELGVDAMTVSAHKFHGPPGIGALLVRHGVAIEPQLFGGFQQMGLRCGTECVALVVGFHRALQLWQQEADTRSARMAQLRVRLETVLREALPWITINGEHAPRLPHTSNLSFPGLDRQALLMALDMAGVCCSTGSACASGSTDPSHVLQAMGCDDPIVASSLRISLGATTTDREVAQACERILHIVNDLRRAKG
jgi:cysteine desulfurase